jgi:nicotinate phosphoribosyltransferase
MMRPNAPEEGWGSADHTRPWPEGRRPGSEGGAHSVTGAAARRPPATLPLLLDLYELTMAQSYFNEGMAAPATFSLFARKLPEGWGYFLAAGLADALAYLEGFGFAETDLAYLASTGRFSPEFLGFLDQLRFTGAVRALPEGMVYFPDEPVLEVTAPIIEAQLVETVLVNQLHYQTLVASKGARCVQAARGRRLVEFGLRRTHGTDAGLKAARDAYLAGFDATSNVLAGQLYGVPIAGTMAHSYIESFADELSAFRAYARTFPDACILLIDTYDTLEGARRAVTVGHELATRGHRLQGVRLDSGDLIELSFAVRGILDAAGLRDTTIFASGSVDERFIARALERPAPIDAFGVGTKLVVSADAPYLDMAYKLVAYDGRPVLKLSSGKATWPGAKQVWRIHGEDGAPEDRIALAGEPGPAGARLLLATVMREGRRLGAEPLNAARERARRELVELPAAVRHLDSPSVVPIRFSERLTRLRDEVAARAAAAPAV